MHFLEGKDNFLVLVCIAPDKNNYFRQGCAEISVSYSPWKIIIFIGLTKGTKKSLSLPKNASNSHLNPRFYLKCMIELKQFWVHSEDFLWCLNTPKRFSEWA